MTNGSIVYTLLFDENGIYWYLDNQQHRDNDLPAVEHFDAYKAWWQNDQRHRITGRATEWLALGEYWINNQKLTYDQWYDYVHITL